MPEPTWLPFVTGPSPEDPCKVLTAAVLELSAVIDGAAAAFARGDTGQAAALMACAEDIRRQLAEWAGVALFYRAAGLRAEPAAAAAPGQRRRHAKPRRSGGPDLRPLSVVALVAAAGQPLRHAVVAHKIAAAAAVTAFAVPAATASIVLLPSAVPAPSLPRHVAVQASTGPVAASPVPQRARYAPRHARAVATPDGTGTPAPSLPFPAVTAPVPSPSVTVSAGTLDIQQVSVVLRPSPTDPAVLTGEIDFRATGGPVSWTVGLDSPLAGLALSASSGWLATDEDGAITVTMPVVTGLLAGSGVLTINGQQVEIRWD